MSQFADSLLYIDGVLRPAENDRTYENIAPTTARSVGRAADGSAADMEEAIAAARRAFDESDWAHDLQARIGWMDKLQAALAEAIPQWRERIAAETGATMGVVSSVGLAVPIEMMKWTIDLARRYEFERDIGVTATLGVPSRRLVIKEAAGVVGAITPWNMPVQINLAKLTAALAAGCTVVLKPAPDTPWSAMMIGEAAAAIGLPRGVLNVVTSAEKVALGEQLVADPRVDVVSFTGSTAVGKRIMEAAAPTL